MRLSKHQSRGLLDDQLYHLCLRRRSYGPAFNTQAYTLYRMFITYKVAVLIYLPKCEGMRNIQVAIVQSKSTCF